MILYTPLQLVFFFFIYCFLGWIIESSWVSLHARKFTNRGFMRGPFIPIYGFGAMTLLLVGTPLLKWPVAVFFAGSLSAGALEYLTGALMEAVFKVRYWDYSKKPLNLNGHICLEMCFYWGVLAVVLDYFLHKPIEALSNYLTYNELRLIVYTVSVYFIADATLSFKAAFDLRAIIIRMEKAKQELAIIKKRLDVILAYANADREEFVDDALDKAEDIAHSIEERFEELFRKMEEKPSEYADNIKKEFSELREKFASHKDSRFGLPYFKGFYRRGLFLGNPSMDSKRFKTTLDTIKNYILDKKDK